MAKNSELLAIERENVSLMKQRSKAFSQLVQEFGRLHRLKYPNTTQKLEKVRLKDLIFKMIEAFKADKDWQSMLPA